MIEVSPPTPLSATESEAWGPKRLRSTVTQPADAREASHPEQPPFHLGELCAIPVVDPATRYVASNPGGSLSRRSPPVGSADEITIARVAE